MKNWMLHRLVRWIFDHQNHKVLIDMIWEQAEETWYEDNCITRYCTLTDALADSAGCN